MAHIIRNIPYAGWKNCISISNTVFDAVISCEVGPRILRYGKVGGPNLLWVNEFTAGQTDETKTWRAYGGHSFDLLVNGESRLVPENVPVAYEQNEDSVIFAPIRQGDLCKEIKVRMCRRGGLEIIHKLSNEGTEPVRIRLNGNTLLRTGGLACLPGKIVCGGDRPELTKGERFSLHRQNLSACDEYSLKFAAEELWCGYFTQGSLFIMTAPKPEAAEGFNLGWDVTPCRVGLGSYAPEVVLQPGESTTHTEVWNIFPDLPEAADEEAAEALLRNNRWYYDFVKKPVKGLDY